jgi:hypothetical protein
MIAFAISRAQAVIGRVGGKARLTRLTPEKRREVAAAGAAARWAHKKPAASAKPEPSGHRFS